MALVTEEEAKAADAANATSKKVAILVFNGVEIIDYTGPYEVFGAAGLDVYTVAATKDPVTTAMGMTVIPKYSFDDAPRPDVLVVPGGGIKAAMSDAATLKWVRDETARIQHTMSVCNGAFILASAGLLDGLSATTTNGNIPKLRAQFPNIKVVDDRRYVDNGKIITTAGLSAGIDGALHIVALILGEGTAQQVALIEEYDWSANSRFVRASLADQLVPNADLTKDYGNWDVASTTGGTDRWELVLRGTSNKTAAELIDHFEQVYRTKGSWTKVSAGTGGTSEWRLKGKAGEAWSGRLSVQETPSRSHQFVVTVKIAKGVVATAF
jgi:putative intracellular protease/amidase